MQEHQKANISQKLPISQVGFVSWITLGNLGRVLANRKKVLIWVWNELHISISATNIAHHPHIINVKNIKAKVHSLKRWHHRRFLLIQKAPLLTFQLPPRWFECPATLGREKSKEILPTILWLARHVLCVIILRQGANVNFVDLKGNSDKILR